MKGKIKNRCDCFENSKLPSFTKCIQFLVFVFQTVEERRPRRKRKKGSIEDKLKALQEVESRQPKSLVA